MYRKQGRRVCRARCPGRCGGRSASERRNRPPGRPLHPSGIAQRQGRPTEEDYTESLIKRAKINFRPGTVLANALASLTFSKVAVKYAKEASEEEEGGGEEE